MEQLTYFADVILPLAVSGTYTYRVPKYMEQEIAQGSRVIVQFGKSRFYSAIVKQIHTQAPTIYAAKYIDAVMEPFPLVNNIQVEFWEWISEYYLCTIGEVMNNAIPAGLKLSSETRLTINPEIDFSELDVSELNNNALVVLQSLKELESAKTEELNKKTRIKNFQLVLRELMRANIIVSKESISEKYKAKTLVFIRLSEHYIEKEKELASVFTLLEKKSIKQLQALLSYFKLCPFHNAITHSNKEECWVKKNTFEPDLIPSLKKLIEKNILEERQFAVSRIPVNESTISERKLNKDQIKAFDEIKKLLESKDFCLLHGITGSGKTEIYCELIGEELDKGNQVLFLVPEIALTTQLIERIKKYFGKQTAVYHSRFSENERTEIYLNLIGADKGKSTQHQIILGTRSSLFLPYSKLGLIIIDEEHDQSYKQHDPAPRYHARDAALYLAKLHHAKVLLGSATPGIESYFNAKNELYGLVELQSRHGNAVLPEVIISDLKELPYQTIVSPILDNAIQEAFSRNEQVIVFQNRRGFAPSTECYTCGWIPFCPNCDVPLIYHKLSHHLTCHYCGFSNRPPSVCSACGSNDLRHRGAGTEKIEEELHQLFPAKEIVRMDLDSTRSKHAYSQIIDDFREGKTDILVGTQMVSKGLDFEKVSVVGVVNADQMLNFPDFRSYEKSFQLLEQVSGRAGRSDTKGKVIIQTRKPDHEVLKWVQLHSYGSFYENQINDRLQFNYPPFARLIHINVIHKDKNLVDELADELALTLKGSFQHRVLGPEYPLISRIKNEFHKRIILKIERKASQKEAKKIIRQIMEQFKSEPKYRKAKLIADVDPY